MIYSAGILLWRYREPGIKEYFLVSPGGPLWTGERRSWGPPKGQMEPTEDPWTTALREFTEETGVILEGTQEDYRYHGLIHQRSGKSVHLFSRQYIIPVDPETCSSNLFTWTDGKDYPEIGHYAWLTREEIGDYGVKAYTEIIEKLDHES